MESFFPFLIKTIFNKLVSSLHIAYITLFYKKLIYKKLGLAWFEASRAAIIFSNFSNVKN